MLPRNETLNAYRSAIRKFALDTDAIVGAISANADRLMTVGRERDTSTTAVPPLRTETILALAATREDQLGQSYERTAPFAGKLYDGPQEGKDWAPIYLSEDLFNSEFGSLLNITDQLLKGWSEAGQVHYIRFGYPPPSSNFPFPTGVMASLKADRLTYNWNTIGIGSVTSTPAAKIFVLNRTGALPVSYCPGATCNGDKGAAVVLAEETAYRWFAGLRDANLGRVVQYTAIYQIFHAFPVTAERDEPPPGNHRVAANVLTRTVRQGFNLISSGQLADKLGSQMQRYEAAAASLPLAMRDRVLAGPRQDYAALKRDSERAASMLREFAAKCDDGAVDALARLIDDRNDTNDDIRCDRSFHIKFADLRHTIVDVLPMAGDADQLRVNYEQAARQIETGYIKTPSIVLSWGDDIRAVGGHNLYSRLTNVEVAPDVAPGQVRIDRSGGGAVLRISPEDNSHASDLSRTFERSAGKSDTDIARTLQAELAVSRPVRPPAQALALADVPAAQGRGLSLSREGDLVLGELGTRPTPQPMEIIARYETEATQRKLDTLVLHDADGYYVLRFVPKPPNAMHATTEPAMLEAINSYSEQAAQLRGLTGEPPVRIGFGDGFSESDLRAIQVTQQTKAAAGGGGGWKPPGPPRNVRGFAPEPDKPNGFFFEQEDSPGRGSAGYAGRDSRGDMYSLKLARDNELGRSRQILLKRVDWENAKIRSIDPVASPDGSIAPQVGFEIELDLTHPPFGERVGLFSPRPLLMRIISFLKRTPAAAERQRVHAIIEQAVKANKDTGALTVDGMIALKSEILREVNPDALEFHVKYGADDFTMVRNYTVDAGAGLAG